MRHLWGGGASAFALALGASVSGAWAQDEGTETREVIIVTGSAIAGAAESAALPVEVYTADDLFAQGNQSTLEFIKSLSIVGSTIGDTNQFQTGYAAIGSSFINLRGLGAGRTLTILNGRRFTENANMVPQIALARTEILKDGAAVIYGADATGGVVNFITRDGFDGVLADATYKAIDGSDGDYYVGGLFGRDYANGNVMFSVELDHRSKLPMLERDWAISEFSENPTAWAPYNNYATYTLNVDENYPIPGIPPGIPGLPAGAIGIVADFTAQECMGISGPVSGVPSTLGGLPVCWWNYAIGTYNLVEDTDQIRAFGQITNELAPNLEFKAQLSYGKALTEEIGTVAAYQANEGPAPSSGTAFQYRIPRSNVYFDDFLAQNAPAVAAALAPYGGFVPVGAITSADQFLSGTFGPNAVPHLGPGNGTGPRTELENWNVVGVLDGEVDDFAGDWLSSWSVALSYNLAVTDSTLPDILAYRFQEALNGFGGPNCNAQDLVPDTFDPIALDANSDGKVSYDEFYAVVGTQNPAAAGVGDCMYLNPFSSDFPGHGAFPELSPNPRYIPGNEISPELSRWLYDDRQTENHSGALTLDALVTGSSPLQLPGGAIAWAAGAQWRQIENRESTSSEFIDPDVMPCVWPGQQPGDVGCSPIGQTPYHFFASDDQTKSDQQQYSYFAELQVPALDTLDFQFAVRREEFPNSDLGATVYKVAGRWTPVDLLTLRASWGTNYATPPAGFTPGDVTTGLRLIRSAGNKYLRAQFETLPGVSPETAEVGNFGAIFNVDSGLPGNGALRFSADYWTFEIIDEIKEINPNVILDSVFAGAPGASRPIDCSAALIDRITFLNGVGAAGCNDNPADAIPDTIGDDVTSIRSVRGNGPGAVTRGFDYDLSYTFEALGGDVLLGATATQITEYEIQAFELGGIVLSPAVDGLGFANYSRDGDLVSEWRANATVNYAVGDHNLRYVLRYIQGVEDDREPVDSPYRQIDDFVTSNVYYQYTPSWIEDLTVSFSIENAFDEDPPFTLQQYSYDPFIGNPLGRTFEIGVRKTF